MPPTKTELFIEATQKGFSDVAGKIDALNASIDKLAKKKPAGLKTLTDELVILGDSLDKIANRSPRGIQKLSTEMDKMRGSVATLTESMSSLVSKLDHVSRTGSLYGDRLRMGWNLKNMIHDVEQMIQVQVRWYTAQLVTVQALNALKAAARESFKFSVETDYAKGLLARYGAMEGRPTEISRRESQEVVDLALKLQRGLGLSFDEIIKSADRLLAAGTSIDIVKKSLESFVKLQVAFPEIEPERFTSAVVGLLNTFRMSPGLAQFTNDAEKMQAILDKTAQTLSMFVLAPKDMGPLLQNMAQLSQLSGFSIDQMMALAGMITNLGAKAGNAGRLLAGLFASLGTEKTQTELERIGIRIDRNLSIAEQFTKIMTGLREAIGTGQISGLSIAGMEEIGRLTSVERQRVLGALVRDFAELDNYANRVAGSFGSVNRAWVEVDNTFKQSWEKFKGNLLQIASAALNIVTPFNNFKEALDSINGVFEKILGKMQRIINFQKAMKKISSVEPGSSEFTEAMEVIVGANRKEPPVDWSFVESWTRHRKSTAGFGLPEDRKSPERKVTDYSSRLRDMMIRELKADNQIEEYRRQMRLAQLELEHKTGIISTQEYNDRKVEIAKEAVEKEMLNMEQAFIKIQALRARGLKEAGSDKAKREVVEESYNATMADYYKTAERLKTDIGKTELQSQIANHEDYKREIERIQKGIFDITVSKAKSAEDFEKASLEQRRSNVDHLYARGLIRAKQYFSELEGIAKDSADSQIKFRTQELQAWLDEQSNIFEKMTDDERKNFEIQKEVRKQNLADAVLSIRAALSTSLFGIGIKREETPETVFGKEGFLGTFKRYIEEATKDFENWGLQIKNFSDSLAKSMTDSFDSLFFDTFKGSLKSLGDYLTSFSDMVLHELSRIAAQMVAVQMMAGARGIGTMIASVFHSGGVVGGGSSFRIVPAGAFANAPRFHSGLAPDERAGIFQVGETILPKGTGFGPKNVVVNVDNQTGTPVQKGNVRVDFDLEKLVVGIILKNKMTSGPLRTM